MSRGRDRRDMTGVEGASGPARFARRAGINGEGDTRDTINADGRSTETGAELRHLRRILSSATGADSSLIFAECASWADSTEGEGRITVATTAASHAAPDGSRSTGGGDGLPIG